MTRRGLVVVWRSLLCVGFGLLDSAQARNALMERSEKNRLTSHGMAIPETSDCLKTPYATIDQVAQFNKPPCIPT